LGSLIGANKLLINSIKQKATRRSNGKWNATVCVCFRQLTALIGGEFCSTGYLTVAVQINFEIGLVLRKVNVFYYCYMLVY